MLRCKLPDWRAYVLGEFTRYVQAYLVYRDTMISVSRLIPEIMSISRLTNGELGKIDRRPLVVLETL